MRKTLLLIVSLVFIASCNQGNKAVNQEAGSTDSLTVQTRKSEMAERMNGLWISDSYLREIEKSKSIYQSRKYTTAWFAIQFEKENLSGEKPALYGMTEHEGGADCPLQFNKETFQFESTEGNNFYYNDPFSISVDNAGLMEIKSANNAKTEHYRFSEDIQDAFRGILFNASYSFQDSLDKELEFAVKGTVKGFEPYNYFELKFDFGEGFDYDLILFSTNKEENLYQNGRLFTYKFAGDVLTLNEVYPNWETMEHHISDTTITLIKNNP